MNRRNAVGGLLALAVMTVPLRATAQVTKSDKPFRVVILPDLSPIARPWFIDGMRSLGWTEGHDFIVVLSGIQFGQRQLDDALRRVLAGVPDVILVQTTAHAIALRRITPMVPIVMLHSGYPVEAGVANSLARPGKNVTGNTVYAGFEVWGKMLQLLREVKPDVKRIGVLWTYVPPAFPREEVEPCYAELRRAEHLLGLRLHIVETANADQVPAALAEIDSERPDALLLTSALPHTHRPILTQFAVNKRLPTIADTSWPVTIEPYPLLSYGPDIRELVRSTAAFVDKILKGAKPGDLPIQQPAKFELVVNLKTAKVIGLTIPQELLLRAEQVIE